ncbi:MAG TPA: sensor domain-containing diguanylate cyclase [Candidatus Ozemobacteraceae bacterium]|nr:sensor domain-containing diguanylate cyclase [Candidatus Ozemobacteraceae bacterium]
MDLNQPYSRVPRPERFRFLRRKLRELQLVYAIDRVTDRHQHLSGLARYTLRVTRRFFRAKAVALLLADQDNRQQQGFFSLGFSHDGLNQQHRMYVKDLLHRHLADESEGTILVAPGQALPEGIAHLALRSFAVADGLRGCLLIANLAKRPPSTEDLHYLKAIISQIDNAIIHGRFLEKFHQTSHLVNKQTREIDFMYEISLSIGRDEDFVSMTRRILESALQLVEVNRCSLMLYDAPTDTLQTELVVGAPHLKTGFRLRLGEGLAGTALKEGKAILAVRGSKDQRFVSVAGETTPQGTVANMACVPLISDTTKLGVLNFTSTDPKYEVTAQELDTLGVVANLIVLAYQRQRLYQLSIKDELTGLYSFRFFSQRLGEELTRASRYKSCFSLVLFDIDHFKKLNDSWGHPFGNIVLKAVAKVLQDSIRQGIDFPARFGGEEFALLLPETSAANALILAERIRQRVGELLFDEKGNIVRTSISGGIAAFPICVNAEQILEKADQSLYNAKSSGRNRIVISDEPPTL